MNANMTTRIPKIPIAIKNRTLPLASSSLCVVVDFDILDNNWSPVSPETSRRR